MTNSSHFRFGCLELMESHAVITCNEGVDIDFDEVREIQAVLYPAYGVKKFGLIANRKNQYSVNPLAIDELFSHEYLVAGAIVGHSMLAEGTAELEEILVEMAPIKYFADMASAVKWIKVVIENA